MNNTIDLSIIIVNYNAGDMLRCCVASIIRNVTVAFEIIVFDNNSKDDSISMVKSIGDSRIKILENKENIGFAKANNKAAQKASGRYFHFLNPDTELTDNRINDDYKMIFSKPAGSVYLNKIADSDGSLKHRRQRIPLLKNYFYSLFAKDKIMYWYTGCSLIICKEDFQKTGFWPEDYFMYTEDLDFFYQASLNGLKLIEIDSVVRHIGKGCTDKVWDEYQRRILVKRSFKKFFVKYHKRFEYYIVSMILLAFILVFYRKDFIPELKAFIHVG
jgi:GT2 family glycosyltransferase